MDRGLPLFLLLAWGLAGCDGLPFLQVCTEIGCSDGLRVDLLGEVPAEFTLRAEAAGEPPRVRECSKTSPCGSTLFFEGFTPGQVTLVLQSSAGPTEMTVAPSYSVFRPNGDDCPPKCRQGVVELTIPGHPATIG